MKTLEAQAAVRPGQGARAAAGHASAFQERLHRRRPRRRRQQHLRRARLQARARRRATRRVGRQDVDDSRAQAVRRGDGEGLGARHLRPADLRHRLGSRVGHPQGVPQRRVEHVSPAEGRPDLRPRLEHRVDAHSRGADRALPDGPSRSLLRAAVAVVRRSRVGDPADRATSQDGARLLLVARPARARRRPDGPQRRPAAVGARGSAIRTNCGAGGSRRAGADRGGRIASKPTRCPIRS